MTDPLHGLDVLLRAPVPAAKRLPRRASGWIGGALLVLLLAAGGTFLGLVRPGETAPNPGPAAAPLPAVTVSAPLQRSIAAWSSFLGQFSAVDYVEIRAQVSGYLTEIHFTDGQIVHKGDLLFVIDPRPFEIQLQQATAQQQMAAAQLELANKQLARSVELRRTDVVSADLNDQRVQQQRAAQAALDQAKAAIRSAQLNLEFSRITAPVTGRISTHRASVGNLINGSSNAGSTTLLTTIVSLDPIYLDFDMSESDYLAYQRFLQSEAGHGADHFVEATLSDEQDWSHRGQLDFLDNQLDRSSGTIHARATVPNPDLFLTPGEFARIRVAVAPPAPTLMVPDSAVLLDQSQHVVMIISADGTVVPKPVQTGDLSGGLRVIQSGLTPDDRVIIDGLVRASPGAKVAPQEGTIRYDAIANGRG